MTTPNKKAPIIICGIILGLWIGGFIVFLNQINKITILPQNTKADAIVVFTGGPMRIDTGLDLLQNNAAKTLLISGVDEGITATILLKLWRPYLTTYPCCITLGHKARNTVQNALETKEWVMQNGISSIILVTANFHMPRALQELQHALSEDMKIYAQPVIPAGFNAGNLMFWRLLFKEYHKQIYSWLRLKFIST